MSHITLKTSKDKIFNVLFTSSCEKDLINGIKTYYRCPQDLPIYLNEDGTVSRVVEKTKEIKAYKGMMWEKERNRYHFGYLN